MKAFNRQSSERPVSPSHDHQRRQGVLRRPVARKVRERARNTTSPLPPADAPPEAAGPWEDEHLFASGLLDDDFDNDVAPFSLEGARNLAWHLKAEEDESFES